MQKALLLHIIGLLFCLSGQAASLDSLHAARREASSDTLRHAIDIQIGHHFYEQQRYDSALCYFTNELAGLEEQGHAQLFMRKLHGIALVRHMQGEHQAAHPYFQQYYQRLRRSDHPIEAVSYLNLAANYGAIGKADSALHFFSQSLALFRSAEDYGKVAFTYEVMGTFFYRRWRKEGGGQLLDSSNHYYRRSLRLQESLERPELPEAMARLFHALGSNAYLQKRYTRALEWFGRGAQLEEDSLRYGGKSFQGLAKTYAALGQYERAYRERLRYEAAQETVNKQEMQRKLEELQIAFDTERKEQENQRLSLENRNQAKLLRQRTRYLLVIGFLALLLLVLAALLYRQYRRAEQANAELADSNAELREEREHMELRALLAQMNPHFLFNALNSVQRFVLERDIRGANQFLAKFGKLVRSVLEYSKQSRITAAEELQMLQRYVALENERLAQSVNLEVAIADGLDPEQVLLPALLLQPFVENSIWHGLREGQEHTLNIHIHFLLPQTGHLYITIKDDGKGLQLESEGDTLLDAVETRSVSGIQIARRRLKALWRRRGMPELEPVEVQSEAPFAVLLKIPVDD